MSARHDFGHRRYSERDLGWIELMAKLRATGMPVREVRRYAELVRAGSSGNEDERPAGLRVHREQVRAQLDTITAYLDAIDIRSATTPARAEYADRRARVADPKGYPPWRPAACAVRGFGLGASRSGRRSAGCPERPEKIPSFAVPGTSPVL
jgi:DNA-binding transcriptional MerR regulator